MVITFEELRNIKDRLPHGGLKKIADELKMEVNSVRNYFGGHEAVQNVKVGIHVEQGIHGGFVRLDDLRIYEKALNMLH